MSVKELHDITTHIHTSSYSHFNILHLRLSPKDPLQSTLEPLAEGIRTSFATGNVEFAMGNSIYYVTRSLDCGKNVHVLAREVDALACQNGNHFGTDSSGKLIYSPHLQFFILPLHNILREFEGEKDPSSEEEQIFPFDKVRLRNNEDILSASLESGKLSWFHSVVYYQTMKSIVFRDMECALKCVNLYYEHILVSDIS